MALTDVPISDCIAHLRSDADTAGLPTVAILEFINCTDSAGTSYNTTNFYVVATRFIVSFAVVEAATNLSCPPTIFSD